MRNKYNASISTSIVFTNITRLTNQIWKLLPMRENNENWSKQLQTVIIEIAGLGEILFEDPLFLQLLSKLEGLLKVEVDFETYRKTIFEAISLIQTIKEEIKQ